MNGWLAGWLCEEREKKKIWGWVVTLNGENGKGRGGGKARLYNEIHMIFVGEKKREDV